LKSNWSILGDKVSHDDAVMGVPLDKGGIFGGRHYNRPDPYLNSAIVLFDIVTHSIT